MTAGQHEPFEADFVVVGAGSAGCAVAARLSEDAPAAAAPGRTAGDSVVAQRGFQQRRAEKGRLALRRRPGWDRAA
jgi:hypothetical protein